MTKNEQALEAFDDGYQVADLWYIEGGLTLEHMNTIRTALKQQSILVEALGEVKKHLIKYKSQSNGSILSVEIIDKALAEFKENNK